MYSFLSGTSFEDRGSQDVDTSNGNPRFTCLQGRLSTQSLVVLHVVGDTSVFFPTLLRVGDFYNTNMYILADFAVVPCCEKAPPVRVFKRHTERRVLKRVPRKAYICNTLHTYIHTILHTYIPCYIHTYTHPATCCNLGACCYHTHVRFSRTCRATQ